MQTMNKRQRQQGIGARTSSGVNQHSSIGMSIAPFAMELCCFTLAEDVTLNVSLINRDVKEVEILLWLPNIISGKSRVHVKSDTKIRFIAAFTFKNENSLASNYCNLWHNTLHPVTVFMNQSAIWFKMINANKAVMFSCVNIHAGKLASHI